MTRELWYVVVTKENKEFLIDTLFNYSSQLHKVIKEGAVVGVSRIALEFGHCYGWDRKKLDHWKNEITLDEMCKKLNIVNPFKSMEKKEPQMALEFTEFLNPTNSTIYRITERSDHHVFDSTNHSRTLDYAFMFYKVVEVIKHFNGKSESFRRGKVAQVINADSIIRGVINDIFAENGEWYVKLQGHGKYLIKDVKITSINEVLFTIDDIIKAFEQNGVSEQFTHKTLLKYFRG